ncbi:MAG: family 43 glycosylhydrolase [Polyangiaceae bacterium]|nr:family 43 glycosylhydrolase [Polyangiaceae bacterium]
MSKALHVLLSLSSASAVGLLARASLADNPIIQTKYTADPAPLVYEDTVYLYTSHDEDNATGFTMYNWMLYSSTDMVNWTDHGIIGGVKDPDKTFKWADGNNAWAPQVIHRNGKFYLYGPFPRSGHMVIGVAVADTPTGPFVDALGEPLINNPNSGNDIDPTVFVDDDGQAYLYWGHQPPVFYVKLNEDMISYSGSIVELPRIQTYEEGPWLWALDGRWYLAFASTCCPEGIGYAMSDSPTGPWTYKGSIMDGDSRSSGNHPGIIEYKGAWYVFGFNYAISYPQTTTQPLPGGHTEQRSICVEKLSYAADGTIPKLPWWTTTGAPQIGTLDPYAQTEAETIAFSKGLKTETCGEGGMDVTAIENGDYIKVKGVDFRSGATSFTARVASQNSGGKIEIRLDSQTGTLVGTCTVEGTGGAQTWATVSCDISGATEVHDVYFVFTGGSGSLFNFNWWKFDGPGDPGNGSGGAGGAGGASGSGATQPTGGAVDTGGSSGDVPTGGTGPTGGAVATGGRSSRGGSTAGGRSATGGETSSGGSAPTGGAAPATGAAPSTGGVTTATGGAPAGGGSTSATGGLGTGGSTAASGVAASGGVVAPAGGTGSPDAGAGQAVTEASSDEGGCGCRATGGRSSSSPLGLLLGVLGLVVLRSHRRRPKAA